MPEGSTLRSTNPADDVTELDALVIGAGFAGLYQLLCLRDRLGMKVRVVEAGDGVGGTWYWNRYPGARCDSESHSYSYYFSKELLEEWEWSERYPQHPEIVHYLNFVADKFKLKRDIQFGTRVTAARYDAEANKWNVETGVGDRFRVTFLITAVGCLSTTNTPKFPGLDSFKGDWYHTGEWPHEGVDLTGKRVGQIGTGSTGIQAAPVIAAQAKHLTIFQRTANYSVPANNHPLSAEFKKEVRDNHEEIRKVLQSTPAGHPYRISERCVFDVDDEERAEIYEEFWKVGGLRFRASFQDLVSNKEANDTAAEFIKNKIRGVVKDPKTAALLTDIDHPYSTKRPPIDTGYFETFNRDNVDLVDVKSAPIKAITPRGVLLENGKEYELDIIVCATGFDAMTGPLLNIDIQGRDGLALRDVWAAGAQNYLGLQVAGFPNMFTITGPGSPSVLCNMPVAIEQHVEWITDCLSDLRDKGIATIETTTGSMEKWITHVNEAANATLMPFAKHTWYFGANVPGKPRVFMPYAGGMTRYRLICKNVAENGYEGFKLSSAKDNIAHPFIPAGDFTLAATVPGPGV